MLRIHLRIKKRLERGREPPTDRDTFVQDFLLHFSPNVDGSPFSFYGIVYIGELPHFLQKKTLLQLRADIDLRHGAYAVVEQFQTRREFQDRLIASCDAGRIDRQDIGKRSKGTKIGLIRDLWSVTGVCKSAILAVLEPVWLAGDLKDERLQSGVDRLLPLSKFKGGHHTRVVAVTTIDNAVHNLCSSVPDVSMWRHKGGS